MQGAAREIAPPSHVPLEDCDWPFWESVVAEFARADWTEHQLELAAMLSRSMADLEKNQRLLRTEGDIVEKQILDGKGEVKRVLLIENNRNRIISMRMNQVLSLRRSLALTGRAKAGGRSDEAAHRRVANKATEDKAKSPKKADLLA